MAEVDEVGYLPKVFRPDPALLSPLSAYS